ncbi:MAG: hypothetical protein QOE93_298 [Actinomycetota bacterium]|jgi:hypothetical protein|nr:hypothetical protein [Actinomycetota bacterium]
MDAVELPGGDALTRQLVRTEGKRAMDLLFVVLSVDMAGLVGLASWAT